MAWWPLLAAPLPIHPSIHPLHPFQLARRAPIGHPDRWEVVEEAVGVQQQQLLGQDGAMRQDRR